MSSCLQRTGFIRKFIIPNRKRCSVMAKYVGYKRPKNTKKAMKNLLRYLGYHKWLLLLVAVLVAISSGVSIAGTYLIRPVINDYAIPGDIPGLIG